MTKKSNLITEYNEDVSEMLWRGSDKDNAKQLSDGDIADCAEKAGFQYSEEKGVYVKHSNGCWICIGHRLKDFARAIEAKIRGEK